MRTSPTRPKQICCTLAAFCALGLSVLAADQTWKGTSNNQWSTAANWSGSAVPGAADAVIYNSSSTANLSNWLSAAVSIKSLVLSNLNANVTPSGGVYIGGSALTLTNGIDLSQAVTNLNIGTTLALGSSPQTWNVASGRTLNATNVVSGSSKITLSGAGTVGLNGTNTFTGGVAVNAGRLFTYQNAALGTGAATVASGAQIYFLSGSQNGTIANALTINGTGGGNAGALRVGNSITVTLGGAMTLGSASQVNVDSGSTFNLNGNIIGANFGLDMENAGTATINGALSLGSGTFIKASSGTLTLANAGNLWTGGTLIGGGTLQIGSGGNGSLGTGPITFTNSPTLTFNTTLPITVADVISGAGNLTQNGVGQLTLSAANTYSGNTTIGTGAKLVLTSLGVIPNNSASTLTVNGLLDVTSKPAGYTVGGTQTITGTGTVNGNLALASGAKGYPGTTTTAGTLTVNGSLSLNGSTLAFDLANVTTEDMGVNDEIVVTGNLNLSGTTTITVNLYKGPLATGAYKLLRYAGAKTGSGSFVLDPSLNYPGLTIDADSTPGYVLLIVAAPQTLTWVGDGLNNLWDIGTTANWTDGTGSVPFQQLSNVRFDDSGSASPNVSLSAPVKPA
ncbi:MAG TPA: autotransporter-associated beta strand repeat-containing protein, partial [Bacillota bacterium]|nr:autotransporter-associated beta strand repeat-containing protein [Bacillota bacterium]